MTGCQATAFPWHRHPGARRDDVPAAPGPHLITSPLSEDTSYLICTDGLTDSVPADVLNQTLGQHQDGQAVFALRKAATEAGGPDNITIALLRAGT